MTQEQWQPRQPRLVLGTTGEGQSVALTGPLFERHRHIMGISGSGKSFALAGYILQLLAQGVSFCLLDPHGDLAKLVLRLLASSTFFSDTRAYERLWYVDCNRLNEHGEYAAALPFNVLAQPYPSYTIANNLLEAMHRAFPVNTTAVNLDTIILMACLVLIQNHRPFTDINRLLVEKDFRETLLTKVTDPLVRQFFALKFSDKVSMSLIESTLKRSYLLSFSPALRFPLCQQENRLNFRQLMDNRISLICNLAGLDDQTKRLLAGLIMVSLEQALLSRADLPVALRHPYHIIADEFQLWMSQSEASFSRFLEESRKYGGVLYCAHQTLGQLPQGIANSLQNAISMVMKAGYEDSSTLTHHFYRPVVAPPEGLFEGLERLLGLRDEPPQNAFAAVTSKDEARAVFENLQRQEALVTIDGVTTKIRTPSIPPLRVDSATLAAIEETYAKRLLTPASALEEATRSDDDTSQKPTLQPSYPQAAKNLKTVPDEESLEPDANIDFPPPSRRWRELPGDEEWEEE